MAEADVSSEGWVYDSIPHYRLNVDVVDGYLSGLWPGYDFQTEVESMHEHLLNEAQIF